MKKILFLGGAKTQLPAIKMIKELGHYLIICDYLEDNEGRQYADEYYNVSIIDKEAVLEVAKKCEIDGVISYSSCAAAPSVAYVAEQLNLAGNPYETVNIVSNKHLFRAFLRENNFNAPNFVVGQSFEEVKEGLSPLHYPLIVKPIDSSGSKGVTRVDKPEDLEDAFQYALEVSRGNTVIVEEFIVKGLDPFLACEVVVRDGRIEFAEIMDTIRDDSLNEVILLGTLYPSVISKEKMDKVKDELQRLITSLRMNVGDFDVECMFDQRGELYFFDMGARNPGHMIPLYMEHATEVQLVKNIVESALGKNEVDLKMHHNGCIYVNHFLFSTVDGVLDEIVYHDEIKHNVIQEILYKEKGSRIEKITGGDKLLGMVFLKFKDMDEYISKFTHIQEYIDIQIADETVTATA